jgi:hypothetical protein
MKSPIKVLIKEPGKPAYYDELPNELEILQKTVDGYIETVTLVPDKLVVICNEEGRLSGLPANCALRGIDFCGTIIICGVDGEDFGDLPAILQNDYLAHELMPELFDLTPPRVCPICKREYSTRPAISRRAPIEICPECGQKEALEDYWQACQKQKNAAREGLNG